MKGIVQICMFTIVQFSGTRIIIGGLSLKICQSCYVAQFLEAQTQGQVIITSICQKFSNNIASCNVEISSGQLECPGQWIPSYFRKLMISHQSSVITTHPQTLYNYRVSQKKKGEVSSRPILCPKMVSNKKVGEQRPPP